MPTPSRPLKLFDYQCPKCKTVIPAPKQLTNRNIHRSVEGHIKTMWCYVCQHDRDFTQLSEYRTMKPEVNMNEITKIEHKGNRVLTTQQLAEFYETEAQVITNNFNRNRSKYQDGTHYHYISGQALAELKSTNQNDLLFKQASSVYLWTEKGAMLHAKSLGTDKAWEVFMKLMDTYFRVKESQFKLPQTFPEALRLAADLAEENQKLLPKAEQFDRFISAENLTPIGVFAKSINISKDGKKMGRNNMFELLREKGILMNGNVPKQEYINSGYFEVKLKPIAMGDKTMDKPQTFVTAKGIDWLSKLLNQ